MEAHPLTPTPPPLSPRPLESIADPSIQDSADLASAQDLSKELEALETSCALESVAPETEEVATVERPKPPRGKIGSHGGDRGSLCLTPLYANSNSNPQPPLRPLAAPESPAQRRSPSKGKSFTPYRS